MKYKKVTKMIAVLLAAAVLAGCSAPRTADNTSKNTAGTQETVTAVTLGELADYFIEAADDYQPAADRAVVLKGFRESEKATKLQMFVIAGRAFGKLTAPAGNAQKMAPPPADLTGMPKWSLEELKNLSDGGILAASDLGTGEKHASGKTKNIETAQASMKDAKILAARYFAASGMNLKDDFYAAVNKNTLETLEIPEGEGTAGGSSAVTANTDQQLYELIMEIVNSEETYLKGSPEQKIRDLYLNVEDMEARNQAGISPIQKYLDEVDAAKNISELNAAIVSAVNHMGNFANGFFAGIPVTDTKDSSRRVLQLMTQTPGMSTEDYDNPKGEGYKTYREALVGKLLAVGESQEKANQHADSILKMEKELAAAMGDQEQTSEIKEEKYYTMKDLDKLMPQMKASELLTGIGLKPDVKMLAFDDKLFEVYAKWFTQENLEMLKAVEKITILTSMAPYLSTEIAENYGDMGVLTSNMAIQTFLSEELGRLYVNHYFSAKSKAEIEKMVDMMTETFKNRIQKLGWMEESTKKEALKKLDTLTILIGYPDEWNMSSAEMKSKDEGGSFFENAAAAESVKWKQQVESLEQPVDPHAFALSAYTVNAAASRNTNTIIFPAGILQAPFYDANASFETNLGAIGSTIAHEITHMFDDGGAQYDAKGNVNNWWEDSDYTHFKALCKKTEEFYDGREAVPGAAVNGKETLSENISDIGGIACGLEILSGMENPDYDAFFKSFAHQWVRAGSYDTLAEMAQTDVHAPNNLRCNRVLVNFQEFYDTYGIKPGDGMYVAPEDRLKIW